MTLGLWHLTCALSKNKDELCAPKVGSSPILQKLCQSDTDVACLLFSTLTVENFDLCSALLLNPIHLGFFYFEMFWRSRVDDLLTIIHWNKFLDSLITSLNSTCVKTLHIVRDVPDTWYPENYYLGASCCFISIILYCWSKETGEESHFHGYIEATF